MSNMDNSSMSKRGQSPDKEARKRHFGALQSMSSSVQKSRPLGSPSNAETPQIISFNSALAQQVCDRVQVVSQSDGRGEIEIRRLRLLEDACYKMDLEYIMMHQLFCWTHIHGSLVNCSYLTGTLPVHDRGLAILKNLLASNDVILRDGVEWFSKFPKPLTNDANKTSELRQYEQELLRRLECMANRWSDLEAAYTARRLPPSFGDITSVLGVRSVIIQQTVLRMILRTLWFGNQDACLQQCEEMFSKAQSSFLFSTESDLISAQALKAKYDQILAVHAQHEEQNLAYHEARTHSDGPSDSQPTQTIPSRRITQPPDNIHPVPQRYTLSSQSPLQSPNDTIAPSVQSLQSSGPPIPAHLANHALNTTNPRSSNNTNTRHSPISSDPTRTTGNIYAHQNNSFQNGQAQNQRVQAANSAVRGSNFSDLAHFPPPSAQLSFSQARGNATQTFPTRERAALNSAPARQPSLGDRQRQFFSPQYVTQILDPQITATIASSPPSTNITFMNPPSDGTPSWWVPQSFNQGLPNNMNTPQMHTLGPNGQGWIGPMNNMASPPLAPPSRPPSMPLSIPPSLPPPLPPSLAPSMSPSMPPPFPPVIPHAIRSNAKSPQLVPADCPDHLWRSRHFRFVTQVIAPASFLTKNLPFQSWSANIERQHIERRATEVPGPLGLPLRPVKNLSTIFRVKSIKTLGARGPPVEGQWTVMDTKWPENVAVSLNGINIEIRRKSSHGKDSPVDVTALVREGHNEIKAGVLGLPEKSDDQYLVALEIIQVVDHAHLRSFMNLLESDTAKQRILQRFHDADPDIRVIERVLDLTDPFTSQIFTIPSRGKDCLHDQCFDLDTFLSTRNTKDSSQPCAPETFKCPICKGDARPSSLVIDGFFLAIRLDLARRGRLDVKAIRVKRGGEWEIKEEEEATGETGDGGSAGSPAASGPSGRRMSNGSYLRENRVSGPSVSGRANSESSAIIILDD